MDVGGRAWNMDLGFGGITQTPFIVLVSCETIVCRLTVFFVAHFSELSTYSHNNCGYVPRGTCMMHLLRI